MTSRQTRAELARYVVAGAINTLVTYALLVIAMHWIAYLLAYTVAYAVGIAVGYALQSRFVFRVPMKWRTALHFPLAYMAQYAFGAALLWLFVERAGLSRNLAALIVVAASVPLGFLLNRSVLGARRFTAR
jgi:putative flippase GtrA